MKKLKFITFIIIAFIPLCLLANNVEVSIPVLLDQSIEQKSINIQFDLSWENSWRASIAPYNWDAVWIFIKYKKISDGRWYHATINTNKDEHSTGSQGLGASFTIPANGKGAIFYRGVDGKGKFASTGIKLNWNYAIDGLEDNITTLISHIKVFAIEMVSIPEGSFYLGSGGNENNHFYSYPNENYPYLISSEGSIPIGFSNGSLNYTEGEYTGDHTGPVPASFPKGYNSLYCMKYEITQEQYSDFLNTLTVEQAANRYFNQFNSYRHYIRNVNGVYGCDANNNKILNELNDGKEVACNFLTWQDGIAYADWSGLRPMSELEFEKICRGTENPNANEFAWGNTFLVQANSLAYINTADEIALPTNANINSGDFLEIKGPVRVGNFARSNSTRQSSGSSYYGVMDMSGNLWERCITIGNPNGRNFSGINGDGILDNLGNANVSTWPMEQNLGSGFRGGSCYFDSYCRVSDRIFSTLVNNNRSYDYGFRCVLSIY